MFLGLYLGLRVSGASWVLIPGIFELKTLFSFTIAVVGVIPRTLFSPWFELGLRLSRSQLGEVSYLLNMFKIQFLVNLRKRLAC